MSMTLPCDCGYIAEGNDEQALVRAAQQHARETHGMEFSAEQVLLVLLSVELDQLPD